ncbi:hypothetical protein NKI48_03180 [Mesorhizobium sp. M0644]|uniref:hypothetical protein n=1 Tax=Mesorhizobium sp. M0644 TaxID=2956979 RepID=UPI0033368776
MSKILLRCRGCGRRKSYARTIDPDIPAAVATIESSACDRCDNGDFGSEAWLDADGKEVSQDIYDDDGEIIL